MSVSTNEKIMSGIADSIPEAILKALKEQMGSRFDDIKNDTIARIEREKDEIIAGAMLRISKVMDIQTSENKIIITIENLKKDNPHRPSRPA